MTQGKDDTTAVAKLAGQFFSSFTEAESELLAQFRRISSPPQLPAPNHEKTWEYFGGGLHQVAQRTIRPELLRWLCSDKSVNDLADRFPVAVVHCHFASRLNLSFLEIPFPLAFHSCWFGEGLEISGTDIPELSLDGCRLGSSKGTPVQAPPVLLAKRIDIRGDLSICRASVFGEISLDGAHIGGDLNCTGSKLHNTDGITVSATAKIDGSVLLEDDFESEGQVRFFNAEISGALRCTGGTFRNPGRVALNAESATIRDAVFLGVPFGDVRDGWRVARDGWGFEADGAVRFFDAHVGSSLICHGGRFHNGGAYAITLEHAKVAGSVLMRFGFSAEGPVEFFGAEITGDIECSPGKVPGAEAGSFRNRGGDALSLNSAKIGGYVDLATGVHIEGNVWIWNATIGRDLSLHGADLSGDARDTLHIRGTEIKGTLDVQGMRIAPGTSVDLTDSSCAVLSDDAQSRPAAGNLALDGFAYQRLQAPGSAATRLEWLRAQISPVKKPGRFRPQPYRQAAATLKTQGLDVDARGVLIGMARDRLKWGDLRWWSWLWNAMLWLTIGGGYQPIRVVACLVLLWTAGFLAFGAGYQASIMVPTDKDAYAAYIVDRTTPVIYEPFCATMYAVDTSLPIISFGQRDKWHPAFSQTPAPSTSKASEGQLYRFFCDAEVTGSWVRGLPSEEARTFAEALSAFRWAYLAIGWFLTTMLVAGVTGLVGRE